MKLRNLALGVALGMTLYTVTPVVGEVLFSDSKIIVHAVDDFEGNDENNEDAQDSQNTQSQGNSSNSNPGSALSEIGKENSLSDSDLRQANTLLKPVTSIIGSITGIIVALVTALIFLITALDLLYICVPFTRNLLFVDGQSGGGMGYGGMGGMGGRQGGHERRQFVSDEAVQCAALVGNNQQQGGGMGYGGMGGMGMQSQNQPTKSVLVTYFKKRVFFMVFFAICVVMLTSSIFLGTGINLAGWLMKMVEMLNNAIPK